MTAAHVPRPRVPRPGVPESSGPKPHVPVPLLVTAQKTVNLGFKLSYDRENNDYKNGLRWRRFKWCGFSTNFILFHMLDTFYQSSFFFQVLLKQTVLPGLPATAKCNEDWWINARD